MWDFHFIHLLNTDFNNQTTYSYFLKLFLDIGTGIALVSRVYRTDNEGDI